MVLTKARLLKHDFPVHGIGATLHRRKVSKIGDPETLQTVRATSLADLQ